MYAELLGNNLAGDHGPSAFAETQTYALYQFSDRL